MTPVANVYEFLKDRSGRFLSALRDKGIELPDASALRSCVRSLGDGPVLALDADGPLAIEPVVDTKLMTATFVISTPGEDRYGDVVLPRGCEGTLDNYRKNPRVFFAHKTHELTIGSARDPQGALALELHDDHICSTCYFHGETAESELIFRLVARKELQAASIGFLPILAALIEKEKTPQRPETNEHGEDLIYFREGNRYFPGLRFHKWDLTEWSIVPVPANAECISAHLSAGHVEGEKLTPSLRKSLEPFAAPKKVWSPGALLEQLAPAPEQEKALERAALPLPPSPLEIPGAGPVDKSQPLTTDDGGEETVTPSPALPEPVAPAPTPAVLPDPALPDPEAEETEPEAETEPETGPEAESTESTGPSISQIDKKDLQPLSLASLLAIPAADPEQDTPVSPPLPTASELEQVLEKAADPVPEPVLALESAPEPVPPSVPAWDLVTDIKGCQRCGSDHIQMGFKLLENPADEWTHWATCPQKGQPVLLQIYFTFDETPPPAPEPEIPSQKEAPAFPAVPPLPEVPPLSAPDPSKILPYGARFLHKLLGTCAAYKAMVDSDSYELDNPRVKRYSARQSERLGRYHDKIFSFACSVYPDLFKVPEPEPEPAADPATEEPAPEDQASKQLQADLLALDEVTNVLNDQDLQKVLARLDALEASADRSDEFFFEITGKRF